MWGVSSISLLELRVAEFSSFGDRTDVLVSILGPLPCSKPAVENHFSAYYYPLSRNSFLHIQIHNTRPHFSILFIKDLSSKI